MSKLYGTLLGDKTKATRCSAKGVTATAQSYEGSASVEFNYINGKLYLKLAIDRNQSTSLPRECIFYVPWAEAITRLESIKE